MASLDHDAFVHATPAQVRRHKQWESWEYRLYFTLIFAVSLPAALVKAILPARKQAFGIAPERRGVWGEAKRMAHTITPLIFSV